MWSDLVPPKQSIGFMPHCRNTDGGQRALDETSSSIEPPTHATYTHLIMYLFIFSHIRCHDKCYGGYTPNLKPMRGARRRARYLSTGVWQASRQTGPVLYFIFSTTVLLPLLTPGSAAFVYIIIYIEQHSFQCVLYASRKTCHSNTPITRLAIPSENKTSVPSSRSRAKPYLDVTPSTARGITAATGRHLSIRSV